MLINSDDRFATLVAARAETQRHRGHVPPPSFYRDKLRAVWERARHSAAYRELGPFTLTAFRHLPATTKEELKSDPAPFATCDLDAAAKYYETTGTTGRPTPTPRVAEDVIWNAVSVAEAWRPLMVPTSRVLNLLPSVVPVGDLIAYACEYLGLPHTRAYPFAAGVCDWDRIVDLWERLRPTTAFYKRRQVPVASDFLRPAAFSGGDASVSSAEAWPW